MWEKIETWHWTILVAVISVLSVLLFQQQVLAQWTPPDEVPGGTNLDNLVVTPMQEDLNLGGFKINDPATDSNFVIDPSAAVDIEATKADFDELCIAGACNTSWPTGGSSGVGDSLWSTSTVNENNIYYSGGNVGIGTNDPQSALHIYSDAANGSDLRLFNSTGDMSIIFQEYDAPPTPYGDISIRYNGNNPDIYDGYANWLEFWGRNPAQGGGRPIMTLQRDYVPSEDNYLGVGIGVPSEENITARLRVQNFDTEDIFQLYDDDNMVFQVSDNGYVGVKGPVHNGVPMFINGSGSAGLKLYSHGLYSYNNSSLELKATNDVYLNPGLYDGVGIEVSNPSQILHVKNPSSFSDTLLRLENNNDGASFSNQTTQIEFARGPNWATDYSWVGPTDESTFDVWTMENVPMLFGTNGGERMRINSTDVILSSYLNLAKVSSAPAATDCDSDAEMGRVKVDNVNSVLYICTGDPGGGIPGSWKSLSL